MLPEGHAPTRAPLDKLAEADLVTRLDRIERMLVEIRADQARLAPLVAILEQLGDGQLGIRDVLAMLRGG